MATINGTPASETINGTNESDTINGFGGDDTIYGFGGDDIINGGVGVDTLYGGVGNDLYIMAEGANDHVKENPDEGIDEVRTDAPGTYILAANVENLTGTGSASTFQHLVGNVLNNRIDGGVGADHLDGYWGDDLLIGGAGADTLYGGRGNDTFIVDANDLVYEFYEQFAPVPNGWDTVLATESYTLNDNSYIEVLATIDPLATTPINLTGNNLHNLIYGNEGNNILKPGQLGISGHGDHLNGNGGNDTYYVNQRDIVIEKAGKGYDTVIVYPSGDEGAAYSYALLPGSHVEVLATNNVAALSMWHLFGNELHQVIYGNNGRDYITSGGGGDHLHGEGGNDTYFVTAGDFVLERAGNGSDTVLASSSYALFAGSHVETLATVDVLAMDAINLTGNEFHNLLYGNNGANVLNGGGGGDHLHGGGGNDVLVESAGGDYLVGGAGNDIFLFQNLNSGIDIVQDFAPGADKFDLSLIDSDSLQAGNNAFSFIGNGAFSGKAGELRIEMEGTTAHILGDVNGDGAADLHIVAYNATQLTAGDFIL